MLTPRLLPAVLLLLTAQVAHAQNPPAPAANDPRAVALLTQMVHTYQGLKSYSATETAEGSANSPGPFCWS